MSTRKNARPAAPKRGTARKPADRRRGSMSWLPSGNIQLRVTLVGPDFDPKRPPRRKVTVTRQPGETDAELSARAEAQLAEMVAAVDEGRNVVREVPRLDDLARQWLASPGVTRLKPGTAAHYGQVVAYYVCNPKLGLAHRPVDQITVDDVERLDARLLAGVGMKKGSASRATRSHARARLGVILGFARRRGFVDRVVTELADGLLPDPVDQLPAAERMKRKTLKAATPDEFAGVLDAARDEGWCWEPALELLGFGLRRGELLGLCWDLVDLGAGTMSIGRQLTRVSGVGTGRVEHAIADVKTDEALRIIPLHTEALTVLRRWRKTQSVRRLARGRFWERRDDGLDLVFTTDTGAIVTHDALRSTVARLCRIAGVRPLSPHQFRHGTASTLINDGVPLQIVAGLLGHSDTTVTAKVYSHLLKAPSEATDALAASRRRRTVTA